MIDNRVWLLHIKEEAGLIIQTTADITADEFYQSVAAQQYNNSCT